jgi:non-haem Fe2+, alpha-ketoglutarate-dependent halogenase
MLTAEQLRSFERLGVLGPFSLPSPTAILSQGAQVSQRLSQLSESVKRQQHRHSRKVFELVTSAALMSDVTQILGPDVVLWVAHLISRAQGDRGQEWHVDSINQLIRGLHVSIAFDDVGPENGCIRFIPGTHMYRASLAALGDRRIIDPWRDDSLVRLADQVAPWNAPHSVVTMNMRAHQYYFTWGGLWHSVGRNHTRTPRVQAVARFARTDVTCRDYGYRDDRIRNGGKLPCILVSGEDRFGLNALHTAPEHDIFDFDEDAAAGAPLPTRGGKSAIRKSLRSVLGRLFRR